jgi:multiple sugar transport system substrate-binding protein
MTRQTFRIAIRKYDPFEIAIRRAWETFSQAEGIALELVADSLDLHPLYETIFDHDALRKGEVDVAFMVTDWAASAKDNGVLLDLAPMIAANPPDGWPEAWSASLLGMQRFDTQIFGLPYHDGPECFIYRSDLFSDPAEQAAYRAQYGAELRVPETWRDFHQVARFFTRPEQHLYGTVFAAFPDGHNTVYDFCLQLWTRGGELFDAANRLQLDTPQAIDALTFYRTLLNDPSAIHPNSREFDSVKSGLAFAAGEVAMMVNWFGFASMCETIADSKVKGNVSIDVIPHAPNAASASLNVYWTLGVGSGSPHRDIAYRFVRHCMSPAMDKLLTLEGAIGCRKSTWADPDVNRIIPYYHRLAKLHDTARELPRLSHWNDLAALIDELVLEVINTDAPIAKIVKDIQAKVP